MDCKMNGGEANEAPHDRRVTYIYGSINNYNVYEAPVTYSAPTTNTIEGSATAAVSRMPTAEQMSQALRRTVSEGYWWSNRAWAVVYRVCQMLGYTGSYSTFVEDAGKWDVNTGYELNYDAIQKPMAKGWLIGRVENWEAQGAAKAFPVLANALLDMLGIDPQAL